MDCIICQNCLKYEPTGLNEDGTVKDPSELKRCAGYYETPCLHAYHQKCLLEWLAVKPECP